jgi:hypothetical protein
MASVPVGQIGSDCIICWNYLYLSQIPGNNSEFNLARPPGFLLLS